MAMNKRRLFWLFLCGGCALVLAGMVATRAHGQAACTSNRSTNTAAEASVIAQVNQLRASHGLSQLQATPALTRAADSHSAQMAQTGNFAHDDLFTTSTRFSACGNSGGSIGENIAGGNTDPTATYLQWFNSPAHLANMLGPYVAIGVAEEIGIYTTGGVTYQGFPMWTMELSGSLDSGQPPVPQPTPQPPAPTPQPPQPSQIYLCASATRATAITIYPC